MSEEENTMGDDELADDNTDAAVLNELDPASSQSSDTPLTDNPDLEVVLDIPVKIAMEVGSTQITIRNLLQLNQGSVIELERLAGEPLDVLVNGTLIAHGEVVVVNEKFGIRVTDVISPSERIKKLK
ncbi:MAG: flagellar motor switch protein FliN [Pseudomonadota bacterium]|nr:flagellar motor switch protein FliN [Pseudomonadota bacterium]